jgi:hypothetical protein
MLTPYKTPRPHSKGLTKDGTECLITLSPTSTIIEEKRSTNKMLPSLQAPRGVVAIKKPASKAKAKDMKQHEYLFNKQFPVKKEGHTATLQSSSR